MSKKTTYQVCSKPIFSHKIAPWNVFQVDFEWDGLSSLWRNLLECKPGVKFAMRLFHCCVFSTMHEALNFVVAGWYTFCYIGCGGNAKCRGNKGWGWVGVGGGKGPCGEFQYWGGRSRMRGLALAGRRTSPTGPSFVMGKASSSRGWESMRTGNLKHKNCLWCFCKEEMIEKWKNYNSYDHDVNGILQ